MISYREQEFKEAQQSFAEAVRYVERCDEALKSATKHLQEAAARLADQRILHDLANGTVCLCKEEVIVPDCFSMYHPVPVQKVQMAASSAD